MFQLPISWPNLFALEREITAAGSKDPYVFPSRFDGTTMSDARREAKAEAAENCTWRGDSPEPEFDDLAHNEDLRLHDEVCSWRGDSPQPEFDDLAHDSKAKESPKLPPKPRATSDAGPHLIQTEPIPSETPPEPETQKDQKELPNISPKEKVPIDRDRKHDVLPSGKQALETPPADNQPPSEERGQQLPDNVGDTPQEGSSQGFRQAFGAFRNLINPYRAEFGSGQPGEAESRKRRRRSTKENDIPSEPVIVPLIPTMVEPQPAKGNKTKEGKKKAKREREEVKKAQKERKVREKEEKRRLRKEQEKAKKDHRCKRKGKKTASTPPELPPRANNPAVAESHAHPGCHICQHPEDEGTNSFMRELMGNAQNVPSFNDIANAAKRYLGMQKAAEPQPTQPAEQSPSWNEEELVDHIAAHIHKHIHQNYDLDSPRGEFRKTSLRKTDLKPTQDEVSAGSGMQAENRDSGGPTSHGLDGNRDWPMTIMQSQILRGLKPASTPEVALTQPPSRAYSPCRPPISRCVSPWCEQLGFKIDDPVPSYPSRSASWSRRG
ncbi:hypothetical protein F5Y06DRAFT_293967 [Hypoxylon sp. FL0890]|nr:hypothetical protein F5Y06DRAFT_293967 [Hypoxylon sp. FL0890]